MSDVLSHYLQEHERRYPEGAGDRLGGLRQSALQEFRNLGFPTRRQENWKYTDVRKLCKHEFRINDDVIDLPAGRIESLPIARPDCHELVFVNGRYSPAHSRTDNLAAGIIVTDLATALNQQPEMVSDHIARYSDTASSGFTALNTAFLQQGSVISLAAGVVLDKPVHLIHINTQQQQPYSGQLRNLILLGDNSESTVIESYFGLDDAVYFTNSVCEIRLDPGSRLQHYRIQQESSNSFHLGHTTVRLQKDSRYESSVVSLGAELSRTDLNCRLEQSGAECVLNGLYMVNGQQHTDHHLRVDHTVEATTSTQNYRGILDEQGRAVFNGKVVVHKGADKTDARQSNANLLLSDKAEIDTKPELEIYADDVKCSHGATVGQLDQNMLFYLRSRGIDEHTARSLLTFAFAGEIIRNIHMASIRERLEQLVLGRLPDAETIREFTHE